MKISYIMQCYLGDYNADIGGRCKSPRAKMIRAIDSVLNQEVKGVEVDVELILVADGCMATKKVYDVRYKEEPRVKFIYLDKKPHETYSLSKNRSRGIPRQVGRSIATGEVTTYLDADDIALPHHAYTLASYWIAALKQNPLHQFCINNAWYDHETVFNFEEFQALEKKGDKGPIEIEGLDSKWLAVGAVEGKISINTGLISHISSMPIKWEDNNIKGYSEDTMFGDKAIEKYFKAGGVFKIEQPIHVRCHNWKCWDY